MFVESFALIDCIDFRSAHMDDELRRLDFFWTCEDRWLYARGLFSWCDEHSDFLETHLTPHIQMPWDNFKNLYGKSVVKEMNNFKDKDGTKGPQSDYKTDDVVSLLKFVSGVYSHHNTLGVNEVRFFHVTYIYMFLHACMLLRFILYFVL